MTQDDGMTKHTIKLYTFEVTGQKEFPFNMLADNRAWPSKKTDATLIYASHHHQRVPRRVVLNSLDKPNEGGWLYYGWIVRT